MEHSMLEKLVDIASQVPALAVLSYLVWTIHRNAQDGLAHQQKQLTVLLETLKAFKQATGLRGFDDDDSSNG